MSGEWLPTGEPGRMCEQLKYRYLVLRCSRQLWNKAKDFIVQSELLSLRQLHDGRSRCQDFGQGRDIKDGLVRNGASSWIVRMASEWNIYLVSARYQRSNRAWKYSVLNRVSQD
jgi:hypothetical protein